MLKRSFAEFHAQRAAPEALAAVEKGQAALAAVRARPFPAAFMGTTKEDVREFHDITARVDELSEAVQVRDLMAVDLPKLVWILLWALPSRMYGILCHHCPRSLMESLKLSSCEP